MDHSALHKATGKKRNAAAKTGQRIKRRSLAQKERRDIVFENQRQLSPLRESTNIAKKTKTGSGSRRDQLKEWKKQKDFKKRQEKLKAKPVFKVATAIKRDDNLFSASRGTIEAQARNTRSKKNENKVKNDAQPPEKKLKNNVKPTKASRTVNTKKKGDTSEENKKKEPKRIISKTHSRDEPSTSDKSQAVESAGPSLSTVERKTSDTDPLSESFAPSNFAFKAPTGLRKFQFNPTLPNSNDSFIYSSRGEKMNFLSSTPLAPQLITQMKPTPVPMVITSASGSSSDENTEQQQTAIEIKSAATPETKEKGEKVQHFRNLITTESKNLNGNCKKWEEIQELNKESLTEEVIGEIRTVIGQAQLLMAERFVQFSGLIDNCENPEPDSNTVTPVDLKGFWDMIYYQVEDVVNKFKKLVDLKENNWRREEGIQKKTTRKRKVIKSTKGSSAHRRAARTRIKKAKEAMKAKLEQKDGNEEEASKVEQEQEDTKVLTNKPSTSSIAGSLASADGGSSQDEGVVTWSRRKTPSAKNVSFASASNKKRKARFDLVNSDDEKNGTPTRSQPRKRVMRKTPLPGSKPISSGEEASSCNEDIQASPPLKKSGGISETSESEARQEPTTCGMKGMKLNFDDIPNDDGGFEARYLLPSESDPKAEDDFSRDGGVDMKYLLPSDLKEDSLNSPRITLSLVNVKEEIAGSPAMVLRSKRKSHQNPMSPFLNGKVTGGESSSDANDLMSFSPAPAKPTSISANKSRSVHNLDCSLLRRSTRLVSRLDSLEYDAAGNPLEEKYEDVGLIPSLL